MEDTRGWKLGKRETEDGLSLIRIKQIEHDFDFGAVPERMTVIWNFQDMGPNQTPSKSESDALKTFEDHVCEGIESDGRAILCIVFTEPGYREWNFYAISPEAFLDVLNQMPPRREPYPIEIHHETDPAGEFYWSYADGMLGE